MVCPPPPSIAWSALILWTITIYGVLGILSLFAAAVHWREPTATGARILRILATLDLVAAAVSPALILVALDAPRMAAVAFPAALALSVLCRAAAGRPHPSSGLPRARLVR